jgi:hypothetical protein
MDPLTLSALGAVALTEGIKFLYGQAGEILKRRRERKKAAEEASLEAEREPIAIRDPGILAGELKPAVIDFDAADRLEGDLAAFSQQLGNYANGLEEVDPGNEDLLRATDALRRSVEAIYQQRITFEGEDRPPSGPVIDGRIDVYEVAGYVAVVRAEVVEGGRLTGSIEADVVREGGEAVVFDVKRIGGRPPD